ncbi:MAG: Phospho-N-acetylmuramoyl-pentapeptide-transferase [Desulfotomaculum sp. 46_80]|nr:MAG: Phospho-N-acetylmuramoyl-pentapeptide-transferase [Desulfotomaculum sp. 46_80]
MDSGWVINLKSFLISLVVAVLLGPLVIPLLRRLKLGQNVRSDGPARHLQKSGTPTMGGVIFLAGVTVSGLLLAGRSAEGLMVLGITLAFGLIGLLDDFIKVYFKRPLGLRAREKLLGQVLFSILFCILCLSALGRGTVFFVPFSGFFVPGGLSWEPGVILFTVIGVVVIVSTANAVNLTDGLDGLAAGVTVLVSLAYMFISKDLGKNGVAVIMAAVAGGCLGFLFFNRHPASVFMGDTGSLALGACLGAAAIVTRTELFLLIIGGVFVLETLSVILQVISFQLFDRRIFLMSPLHHHFELCNWSERKVALVFWVATLVFIAAGLAGFYKLN